jgi:hypothetical protein
MGRKHVDNAQGKASKSILSIMPQGLLVLSLYTFRFGRGISYTIQNQPDYRYRVNRFYGTQ